MGVIQRQGIKSAALNYVGILVGAMSVVWIYPQALAEYGLVTFLTEMAIILGVIAQGCLHVVVAKFFPHFKDEERGHRGILLLAWLANLVGFAFFGILVAIFWRPIADFYSSKAGFEPSHIFYLYIFSYLTGQIYLLSQYCAAFKRVVIAALVDLLMRIARPALIGLFVLQVVDVHWLLVGVLVSYLGAVLVLLAYIWHMRQWHWAWDTSALNGDLLRSMGKYSFTTTLITLTAFLALQLDRITVPSLLTFEENGVYGIALFVANLVAVPMISLSAIALPVVVDHFSARRMEEVQKIYEKTAGVLCVAGVFIFLGVMLNVDDLFRFTPRYEVLRTGVWAVFWLALTRVVDGLGGVSRVILDYSDAYIWSLWLMLASIAVNVALTFWLLPLYGLEGIAIAAAVATTLYTALRVWILYRIYGLLPLQTRYLWAFAWGALVFAALYWLPLPFSPLPNMCLRSALLVLLFVPPMLYWQVSPDVHEVALKFWRKWARKG